ncbi:MAG TPA: DNA gyrase/topoisomerase IV subunit A [Bacteroidales bacterium]|nr:DNA gyrase/topoisomerase IV subunit A [Bacteroidales bacterium]
MDIDKSNGDEINKELPEGEGDEILEGGLATPAEDMHKVMPLTGMYKNWFLDYASYVILERAVPHLHDGLKPVQRRILHSMKRMDDGRYNKVANIIGHTMQFHPHGDASIGDALVQLGQKDILVDTQGNWGNILTGDDAAAPRYIEARLSKFAIDVVFNPKTTEWMLSYDGRNKEPVTLPIKFPLLLVQGVEGIAVGLASKILPHNFNELIDASIAYLKNQPFELYPDFPTGGLADVSRYNDGLRGGSVRVRARINKSDKKALVITEIPFGTTTTSLIESILKANEKGKIKIRKVDDNTAENVEIVVYLAPGVEPDKTIDALYAFTDCEIPISPNSCVIEDDKPRFIGVTEMLKISTDNTLNLLRRELQIRLAELEEEWHLSSLEKIFFEQKIYRELEKDTESWEEVLVAVEKGFDPYRKLLRREITRDDVLKLTEKPVRKISKFDIKKADEYIKGLENEMETVKGNIESIVKYTIDYFLGIKKKYGAKRDRKTELRNFDTIQAAQVVIANEKLYVNYAEGFAGYGMKRDQYICDCSDMDDLIAFRSDGTYIITKVQEKAFLGKNLLYVNIFRKNDNRTIYNVIYRDGKNGAIMMKRCAITGITRDKEYNLTKGTPDSQILYFTPNPNGEAEIVRITLRPRPRLKNLIVDLDFGQVAIKGRDAQGNILTRYGIHKIILKEKGSSTLGGQKIWFDETVSRLNTDGKGTLLGEFRESDKIIEITRSGYYRIISPDVSMHFEDDVLLVSKFNGNKVYSAVYYDAEQKAFFMKRFVFDSTPNLTRFVSEDEGSRLVCISALQHPRFKVKFGASYKNKPAEILNAEEFIAIKGMKAKGKRVSALPVANVEEIEPAQPDDEPQEPQQPIDGDLPIEDGANDDAEDAPQMTLDLD